MEGGQARGVALVHAYIRMLCMHRSFASLGAGWLGRHLSMRLSWGMRFGSGPGADVLCKWRWGPCFVALYPVTTLKRRVAVNVGALLQWRLEYAALRGLGA